MNTSPRSGRSIVALGFGVLLLVTSGGAAAFAHCPDDDGVRGDHPYRHGHHHGARVRGADVVAALAWNVDWPFAPTPYDTLCNPGSPQYAPRACLDFYEYLW